MTFLNQQGSLTLIDGRATEQAFQDHIQSLVSSHILKKAIQCGGLDKKSKEFKPTDCEAVYRKLTAAYESKVKGITTKPFSPQLQTYVNMDPTSKQLTAPPRAKFMFCSVVPEELTDQARNGKFEIKKI